MKTFTCAALLAATLVTAGTAHAAPDLAAKACHRHHPELHCNDLQPMCFAEQRRVYDRCLANARRTFMHDPLPHVRVLPPVPVWQR